MQRFLFLIMKNVVFSETKCVKFMIIRELSLWEVKAPFSSSLGCYGVSGEGAELDDWLCARCEADAVTEVPMEINTVVILYFIIIMEEQNFCIVEDHIALFYFLSKKNIH